jgi:hypothetical protein
MVESQQVLEWQQQAEVAQLRRSILRALQLRFQVEVPPDLGGGRQGERGG